MMSFYSGYILVADKRKQIHLQNMKIFVWWFIVNWVQMFRGFLSVKDTQILFLAKF